LRDDLPDIVSLAKSLGFPHVQINTNGLRIAKDPDYLQRLAHAGADLIYLQFDGVSDGVYRQLRGMPLAGIKERVIENCAQAKVGVQLVPTLVPVYRVNKMLAYASENSAFYRGVALRVGHIDSFAAMARVPFTTAEHLAQDPYRLFASRWEGWLESLAILLPAPSPTNRKRFFSPSMTQTASSARWPRSWEPSWMRRAWAVLAAGFKFTCPIKDRP
jgi:hypothetical protein